MEENSVKYDSDLFEFASYDKDESEHIAAPKYSYWKSVWRTFVKDKFTVGVAILLLILILFALIQPSVSGYDPLIAPNINNSEMRFINRYRQRRQRGVRRSVGRREKLHHHQFRLHFHHDGPRRCHRRGLGLFQEDRQVDA